MKNSKIKSLAIVMIGCMSVAAQNNLGTKLDLRQCIETGIANNLTVLQSGLNVETAEVNWKQAKATQFPNLNASVNHGLNMGRSIDPFTNAFLNQRTTVAGYSASSGVVLFNGFSIQSYIKQNKLIYQATQMESQQAKDNLTINIILAYLDVLNNEEVLVQSQNSLDLTKNQVDRLSAMDKEGAITPSLLSDMKGQYAGDKLAIINTRKVLETAKVTLCQLMNIPYDPNMQLEKLSGGELAVKYETGPDIIYQAALEKFAIVKAVDLRKQSLVMGVKTARGQLFPTLSLNGNVNTTYSNAATQSTFVNTTDVVTQDYVLVNGNPSPVIVKQNNYNVQKITYGSQLNNDLYNSINLSLRIPIFNSFQAKSRLALARIDLKNGELISKSTRTELRQAIDQAYINMTSASERFKTLLEQVSAYQESFHAAEARFNAGVGSSIEYLTAKNNMDAANINLISAKYDYILRTKILDYYQGKQLW